MFYSYTLYYYINFYYIILLHVLRCLCVCVRACVRARACVCGCALPFCDMGNFVTPHCLRVSKEKIEAVDPLYMVSSHTPCREMET